MSINDTDTDVLKSQSDGQLEYREFNTGFIEGGRQRWTLLEGVSKHRKTDIVRQPSIASPPRKITDQYTVTDVANHGSLATGCAESSYPPEKTMMTTPAQPSGSMQQSEPDVHAEGARNTQFARLFKGYGDDKESAKTSQGTPLQALLRQIHS